MNGMSFKYKIFNYPNKLSAFISGLFKSFTLRVVFFFFNSVHIYLSSSNLLGYKLKNQNITLILYLFIIIIVHLELLPFTY
jgi:hypothetical protein